MTTIDQDDGDGRVGLLRVGVDEAHAVRSGGGRPNRPIVWSRRVVPGIAGATTLVLCLRQVLISPVVVLANNGDFGRILSLLGLRSTGPNYSLLYGWVHYVDGHTSAGGLYLTSELPLAGLTSLVAHIVLGGSVDIRVLGTVFAVLVSGLVYLICRSVEATVTQVVLAAVLLAGLCDSRLVAYFNTWYDEPWSLVVLLVLVLLVLANRGRRSIGPRRGAALTAVACLLVTSKSQDAVLALPLAIAVAVLVRDRGVANRWRQALLPAACGLAIVGSAAGYVAAQAPIYGRENQYDLIFADLLVHDRDPAATLRSLGLPAAMLRYRGTNAYEPWGGFHSASFNSFETHGGQARVFGYFLGHPAVALDTLARGARNGWQAHLDYLGYRTEAQGVSPRADACEPCLYSRTTADISGTGPWITMILFGAAAAVALAVRRRRLVGVADALLMMVAISGFELCAAVFGEGAYEESKHLYLFYVTNLLLLTFTVAGSVHLIVTSRQEPHSGRSAGQTV